MSWSLVPAKVPIGQIIPPPGAHVAGLINCIVALIAPPAKPRGSLGGTTQDVLAKEASVRSGLAGAPQPSSRLHNKLAVSLVVRFGYQYKNVDLLILKP